MLFWIEPYCACSQIVCDCTFLIASFCLINLWFRFSHIMIYFSASWFNIVLVWLILCLRLWLYFRRDAVGEFCCGVWVVRSSVHGRKEYLPPWRVGTSGDRSLYLPPWSAGTSCDRSLYLPPWSVGTSCDRSLYLPPWSVGTSCDRSLYLPPWSVGTSCDRSLYLPPWRAGTSCDRSLAFFISHSLYST